MDEAGAGGEPIGAEDERTAWPDTRQQSSEVDRVIGALADPTRRQILRMLGAERRGLSASALAGQLPVSRQAVAQHLSVLQQAALVGSERSGREVLFSVRPSALEQTASWMTRLAETWAERLQLLKQIAEAERDEQGDNDRT
jgi:DNA-binding transcriptional ArsR family regulator